MCYDDIELPKRKSGKKEKNTIYEEIENFEDYEFTTCIAYEMAIRSGEVSIKKDIDNFHTSEAKKIEEDRYIIEFSDLIVEIKDCDGIRFSSRIELVEDINKDYFLIESSRNVENNFKRPTLSPPKEDLIEYDLIPPNFILKDLLLKKYKKLGIFESYQTNQLSIDINPDLPKEELIAYISKIKDEYDKEKSIIKSPLELLGEELEPTSGINIKDLPKKEDLRKKAYADAFFVYDLYKILEPRYNNNQKEIRKNRDEEIGNIRASKKYGYSKDEKDNIIDEIKENYRLDINEYNALSLKGEIAKLADISVDKVTTYQTAMKKYIDELKYKELITGTLNQ